METNSRSRQLSGRKRAISALKMLFVGDSLSMPVHWYYRPADILRAFPPSGIRHLSAAPLVHPGSIMSLHSTSGGGRSARHSKPSQQIVGDVILKGKGGYWNQKQVHYHQGLGAGENTLNTWCAHLLLNWTAQQISKDPEFEYDAKHWLNHYIEFMTADPPQHPDTYAESYHRGFFANLVAGKPVEDCGAVTHDTPSMGGLVTVAPLALALLPTRPVKSVQAICRQHVWSTHPDELLMKVVDAYVKLMGLLLNRTGADDQEIIDMLCDAAAVVDGGNINGLRYGLARDSETTAEENVIRYRSEDMTIVGGRYSLACYITDSWPSVCYLAARHFKDPKRALLINTNLGGENAHRGSVLGSLLGLVSGESVDEFYNQLAQVKQIDTDIERWSSCVYRQADGARPFGG